MAEMVDWLEIADDFDESLLIGNGASMAVDVGFSYHSLLAKAREDGLITPSVQRIFDYTRNEDFELAMSMIWHAFHVNKALEVEDNATAQAYRDIQAALVTAVQRIHASYDVARPHLGPISSFLGRFKQVFSLNYDLLVYWAMMHGNNRAGGHRFKDCFVNGEFAEEWEKLREPMGGMRDVTLVFYPHGNLALATSVFGQEVKLSGGDTGNLLEHIVATWQRGDFYPLFVSEGETKQKELAIMRSPYLRTVFSDAMAEIGGDLAIFGWSADPRDDHILRRLTKAGPARVAISYFLNGRSRRQMERACDSLESRIEGLNEDIEVVFFDSEGEGCWLLTEDAV
jgi:hypothetical protein